MGLSNNLSESDVLLFLEFINIKSILYFTFIELIVLLYAFLVISFASCKKYMIWRTSFSKFSYILPVFTYARAIVNCRSICLGDQGYMVNKFRVGILGIRNK